MFTGVPTVDVATARQYVQDGATLLDVRRDDEWEAGHVPGADHIPLDQLPARLDEVPVGERVVAVCRSGARSAQATQYLQRAGFDAVNLGGGMQAWAREGGAVVTADGGSGRVA